MKLFIVFYEDKKEAEDTNKFVGVSESQVQ